MIDEIDRKILNIIQSNARASHNEIAKEVGMAASAIFERIRKLEKRGIIQGYETRLNPKALDLGLVAFIFIRAHEHVGTLETGKLLAHIPEVLEIHDVAGEDCYLVKVRVANTEASASCCVRRSVPLMPSHRRVRPLCLRLSKKPLNCPSKMNHSPFQEQGRALFLTSGLTRRCCHVKHGLKQFLDLLRRPHEEGTGAAEHHSTRSLFSD